MHEAHKHNAAGSPHPAGRVGLDQFHPMNLNCEQNFA